MDPPYGVYIWTIVGYTGILRFQWSNWVNKRMSHEEYLTQDLFFQTLFNQVVRVNLVREDEYDFKLNNSSSNN